MSEFLHLHCHTQYSLLDGASPISDMMDKAQQDGQLGVALTDHGNMFGAFKFVSEAKKRKIKYIYREKIKFINVTNILPISVLNYFDLNEAKST